MMEVKKIITITEPSDKQVQVWQLDDEGINKLINGLSKLLDEPPGSGDWLSKDGMATYFIRKDTEDFDIIIQPLEKVR